MELKLNTIPDDWKFDKLVLYITISHGYAFKSEYFTPHGTYRLMTPGHFYEEGGFRNVGDKQKYYGGAIPNGYVLEPKDVVVAMTEQADGLLGSAAIIPDDGHQYLHNQRIGRIHSFSPNVNLHFIYYLFNSTAYRHLVRESAAGTKVKHTSPAKLLDIEVPLPPLPEQRAIAEALSDVDALIASLDQLIAKKRDIKQGTMQQLLTGKTRLPGFDKSEGCFKQTEVGLIPEDWNTSRLEPLSAFITKGTTPTTYGFRWRTDGILFLRSECVSENGLDLTQSMFISDEAHATLGRSEVTSGDILMTITGNIGRVILLDDSIRKANINQHIARIRITNHAVSAEYVYHYLSQPVIRKYYGTIITGQAYPQISLGQVRNTHIPLPSLAEQQAIAAALSDMDTEIAALESRRDKTIALKQGMMQELLTGRTRLL